VELGANTQNCLDEREKGGLEMHMYDAFPALFVSSVFFALTAYLGFEYLRAKYA